MEFVPVAAMAALILKCVDLMRYLRAGDINGVVTQVVSWLAGVIVVMLVAHTDWADGIAVGDMSMATLNIWSLVFFGLSVGSGASLVKDLLKAVDNSNSAAIPVLVAPRGRPVEPQDIG